MIAALLALIAVLLYLAFGFVGWFVLGIFENIIKANSEEGETVVLPTHPINILNPMLFLGGVVFFAQEVVHTAPYLLRKWIGR